MKLKLLLVYSFSCLLLQAAAGAVNVQQHNLSHATASIEKLELTFLKDTIVYEQNGFLFNNIKVKNTSLTNTATFSLAIGLPTGWQQVNTFRKKYELAPGKTETIAIRLSMTSNEQATLGQKIQITITDTKSNTEQTSAFWVKQKIRKAWKAALVAAEQNYDVTLAQVPMQVQLHNTGNISETVYVSAPNNPFFETVSAEQFLVEPMQSRQVTVMLTPKQRLHELGSQRIKVLVTDNDTTLYTLTQELLPVGSVNFANTNRLYHVPVTTDLLYQNIGTTYATVLASAYGSLALQNGRALFFSYRSNYLVSNNAQSSTIWNVLYKTPTSGIAIGTQAELYDRVISGQGIKYYKEIGKTYVEVLASKNTVTTQNFIAAKYQYRYSPAITLTTKGVVERNDNAKINNQTLNTSLSYFNANNLLEVSAGLGNERSFATQNATGFVSGNIQVKYDGHFRNIVIRSANIITGRHYPGLTRGYTALDNEITYQKKNQSVSFNFRSTTTNPENTLRDRAERRFHYDNKTFQLKYQVRGSKISLEAAPAYVTELQDSIKVNTLRSRQLLTIQFSNLLRIQLYSYHGINTLASTGSLRYFTHSTRVTLQKNNSGIIANYFYGPFTNFEVYQYAVRGMSFDRVSVSPFVEKRIANFTYRFIGEYNHYLQYISPDYVSVRNEISYQINDLNLMVAATYKTGAATKALAMNAGIRKTFELPAPGLPMYHTLKLVFFKDLNNNQKFEANEQTVAGEYVMLNTTTFVTNEFGEVIYKNIASGQYQVSLLSQNTLMGWIDNGWNKQPVVVDHDRTYYMPFVKSKEISGQLVLDIDKYSPYRMDLANIRITATNTAGKTYSVFTNASGAFNLSLPDGDYTVSMNAVVLGDQYQLEENNLRANLAEKEKAVINFKISERKRKVNIRKGE